MSVVYDLLGFQSRDHGERGIARYVLHLGLAIERLRPGLITEFLMHPDLPFPAGAEPLLATGRVVRTDEHSPERSPTAGGVFLAGSPFESFNHPSELILPGFARAPQWRSICVIHDLIPAIFPDLYLDDPANRNYYGARLNALRAFDRYLSNSQATSDDAVAMLGVDPAHVTLVGAGADERFVRPVGGHEQAADDLIADGVVAGLRPGFILFPTGIDPRKNIERTIHAYGQLPEDVRRKHQLVLACRLSDPDRREVNTMAAEAGIGDELLVTGYVSDPVLCQLYQAAHLVVFPSFYEGFGLPALEAMSCGAPVICADATSLKEVQLIDEARFDPMSVDSITDAMARALADEDLRARLRTQELPPFTWELAAERTVGVIDELGFRVGGRRIEVTAPKPRLALFSPLPPQPTDVATYTFRLLEALRAHCDVTVFVDANPLHVWAPEGVEIEPVQSYDDVKAGGGAFDRTLYILGNDSLHVEALRALDAEPGPVLLHSVRLTEVYNGLERSGDHRLADGSVGATIARMYPGRYRAEVEAMSVVPTDVADRFGVLMTAETAQRADEVLVHSAYAASMVQTDSGIEATIVSPLPSPRVHNDRSRAGAVTVVSAFGPVSAETQADKLITAWAETRATVGESLLRFVGPVVPDVQRELEALAGELGVGESVEFCGHVGETARATAQSESTVAVQLLTHSDGGSPAAVPELLALGVPTIATDIGPIAELADEVVVKVAPGISAGRLGALIASLIRDADRQTELSDCAIEHARANTFAATAEKLAEVLFGVPATDQSSEAPMDDLFAPIRQTQQELLAGISRLADGQAAYVGDHQVLTRLFTGQKMFVDSRDISLAPALIIEGRWEQATTDVMLRILQPTDHMIDIGANVGYFGVIAGTIIDREGGGSIHLVEANPHLVDLAFKTLSVTGLVGRATVSNYAISDQPGELELQVPEQLWGSAFLGAGDDAFAQKYEATIARPLPIEATLTVPAITLDEFVAERGIERIDLIKMDIEGHEERAYYGMARVLDENREHLTILMEFSGSQYEDPSGFFDQIRSDFKFVQAIEPGSDHPVDVGSYAEVAALSANGFVMLVMSNREIPVPPAA